MTTPWIFEFFHSLPGEPSPIEVQEHLQWYLGLWQRAEERGFHGIFFSEHHFGAAYSPSPNLLVAALASRTTTLRLGVLGTATPYTTPWRIAEEFGMLDQLTGGRFEGGVVSGIPPELALIGIDPAAGLAHHQETVEALLPLLKGRATHRGERWSYADLEVMPRPLQQPLPLWTAARSAESAERAGRLGLKVCLGFLSTDELSRAADAYRRGADERGRPADPGQIGFRRLVNLTDDPAAQDDIRRQTRRDLFDLMQRSAGSMPPWAALLDRPDYEGPISGDEFVAGTPSQVAEELKRQAAAIGAEHVVVCFSPTRPAEIERSTSDSPPRSSPLSPDLVEPPAPDVGFRRLQPEVRG